MIIYDEEKRLLNIKNHGIDFVNAQTVFDNFHITREDYREYGEQRFQTLGLYNNMVVVMMIHTPKNYDDRIISILRQQKMNKNIIGNNTSIADQTDWQKVLNMKDKDIDFTDNPETCAEDWAGAVMKVGDKVIGHTPTTDKEWVRIPFDSEILRAFQAMETD